MTRGLSLFIVLGSVIGALTASNALAAGVHGHKSASHHRKVHHGLSWHERDRAVYAVSTLNAPLCTNGKQLSAVLVGDGARFFDVGKSMSDHRLYYIVVRTSNESLMGVYAYRFGWKLPQGVASSECVTNASDNIAAGFKNHTWKWEVQFTSTFPQS